MKSARSDTPGFRLPGINKAGLQAGSLLSRSRGLTPSTPETTAKTEKSKAQRGNCVRTIQTEALSADDFNLLSIARRSEF
jgi:hypothetical protein